MLNYSVASYKGYQCILLGIALFILTALLLIVDLHSLLLLAVLLKLNCICTSIYTSGFSVTVVAIIIDCKIIKDCYCT